MQYCITGGSGFIGRYFYEVLLRDGHSITILDLVEPDWDASQARFVHGDIRDPEAVRDALAGCDTVINLAAAHHDFGIADETYFDVNENGAKVICAVMDELGIRTTCFYSTVAIYGHAQEPIDEDTPPNPFNPYGASKLAGEEVFRTWTEQGDGRTCLVIRPTVTFGPRNFANMYTLIDQIERGRFLLVGKGANIKSLSYVENIVAATIHLWTNDDRPAYAPYNFIDKPDYSSMEIAAIVYEALGKRVPRLRFPMWLVLLAAVPFDVVIKLTGKNLPVSSARVKKMFSAQTKYEADRILEAGFKPVVPLRQGIERMVKWYLAEGKDQEAVWHQPPAKPVMRTP